MRSTFAVLLSVLIVTTSFADGPHKIVLIKEALTLAGAKEGLERLRATLVSVARKDLISKAGAHVDDPGMKDMIDRTLAKFSNYVNERFDWATLEKEYIADYDEALTESDLETLLVFERSESGLRILKAQQQANAKANKSLLQVTSTINARLMAFLKETKLDEDKETKEQFDKEAESLIKKANQSPESSPGPVTPVADQPPRQP